MFVDGLMYSFGLSVTFCPQILKELNQTIAFAFHAHRGEVSRQNIHIPHLTCSPSDASELLAQPLFLELRIQSGSLQFDLETPHACAQPVNFCRSWLSRDLLDDFSQFAQVVFNSVGIDCHGYSPRVAVHSRMTSCPMKRDPTLLLAGARTR